MKFSFLITLVALNFAVFAQKTITIEVKENTVPCVGVVPMNCLQVKEEGAKNWSNFYSAIAGFDYQPGYLYKLKVIKTKRSGNIPADASVYTYQLKKVVYKKKVQSNSSSLSYLNKKMVLTQLNGKNIIGDKVYLTLDNTQNRIFGKSGCNKFNATYKLSGNTIEINLLTGTLMACDQESMKLEQEFTAAMKKKSFEIQSQGNTVHFKDTKTKKVVLTFVIPAEKNIWSFIDGKKWKLIQLDRIGKDYGKAMIQFDLKTKRVSGNTGCNNFFGNYAAKNNEISFSALGSTKMACPSKNVMDTEIKMLKYLSHTTMRFDVADQTLNFYQGDQLVMMFAWVK